MKRKTLPLILLLCVLAVVACVGGGCKQQARETNCQVSGIAFEGIESLDNIDAYAGQVMQNGRNYDGPLDRGIVVSPYYTLKINGERIPVYSTRCAGGLHSFAYVDVDVSDPEKAFLLETELTALEACTAISKKDPEVVVLPEKRGVSASVQGKLVKAEISAFGSFTFAFNRKPDQALTLYIAPKTPFAAPEGYEVKSLAPGKHTLAETTFTETQTAYVFQTGRHLVDSIRLPSNTLLWLEPGAYLEIYPDGEGSRSAALISSGTENIAVGGRGIWDFSACMGGDAKIKGAFDFHGVKGAEFSGMISINSNTWTLCFTDCENLEISRNLLFGFRTYSDGIMLSDCRDAVVSQCFVRTGDDAMETKSTSAVGQTDNVTFRDNDCWTDKGLGYGVVWESNHDTQNVRFVDCSVGFALSNWNARNGALAVQIGDRAKTVRNVRFENIEIYRCESHAVINCELKQKGKAIEDIYFRNVSCKMSMGYLFRLAEVELENGRFGKFYLDNVSQNGVTLTEDNRNDEFMMQLIIGTVGWDPDSYIKINTLAEAV